MCLILKYLYGVLSGMSQLNRSWIHAIRSFIPQHSQQGLPSSMQDVECMVSIPFSMSMLTDIMYSSYSSHGHSMNGVHPSGTITWNLGQWQVWMPELGNGQQV